MPRLLRVTWPTPRETYSRLDRRRARLLASNSGVHTGGIMLTRRNFLKLTGASTIGWYVATQAGWMERAVAQIPGGTLNPGDVPKVPDRDADSPGDAPGGDDHDAGWQAGRLLRDLDAAALPADPARGHARHDRLGVWGRQVSEQQGAAAPPSALAHDRDDVEAAGAHQVDQRAGGRRRQLPAAPAARGPHVALGQSARRDGGTRYAADIYLDARPLHRPRADRDAPARRGRGRRRERRLRRGLVPAGRGQHPRRLRDRGHLV